MTSLTSSCEGCVHSINDASHDIVSIGVSLSNQTYIMCLWPVRWLNLGRIVLEFVMWIFLGLGRLTENVHAACFLIQFFSKTKIIFFDLLVFQDLGGYIFDCIPEMAQLKSMNEGFYVTYAVYATRKFLFFLDERRLGYITLKVCLLICDHSTKLTIYNVSTQ